MFDALGDRDAQEAVRKRETDKAHCSILRESPFGCSALPRDFDGDMGFFAAGSVCPNNPFVRFADRIARRDATEQLLERAADLRRAAMVGAVGAGHPSVEVTMAHTYMDWIETKRHEALCQARLSDSSLK